MSSTLSRLRVLHCGWGQQWPLGVLADIDGRLLFEYSPEAIARGIEFSPLHAPLPRRDIDQTVFALK